MRWVGWTTSSLTPFSRSTALQCLIHIVDALAVTSLNVVDNDLCGKCADCPIRMHLDGILDTLDIFSRLSFEEVPSDYQDLLVANLILIARIVQARVAGITTKIIWICVLAFYQLLLLVSQGIPCLFGCLLTLALPTVSSVRSCT